MEIVDYLKQRLTHSYATAPYHGYLTQKLMEQQQRNQDDLHFVHSQVNVLFDYFRGTGDFTGMQLLEGIEQECC